MPTKLLHSFMGKQGRSFVLGLGTALAAGAVVPVVQRILRPTLKAVVREGIRVGEQVKVQTGFLRESWDDLVAEARHDMESEQPKSVSAEKHEKHEKSEPGGHS